MILVTLLKKEHELLESTNPKSKILGLMLKKKRLDDEKAKNEANREAAIKKSNDSKTPIDYAPQRQDHCYIYDFAKNTI